MTDTIILGIVTSFTASLIFTFFFTKMTPIFEISKGIAFTHKTYKIKIINKSKYAAINIKAELSFIKYFTVPDGRERRAFPIQLVRNEIFEIDTFDKKSDISKNTYRFVTNENIAERLIDEGYEYIRFKIYATHSLSNIGKVYEMQYLLQDIQNGDFSFGNNTEIKPL